MASSPSGHVLSMRPQRRSGRLKPPMNRALRHAKDGVRSRPERPGAPGRSKGAGLCPNVLRSSRSRPGLLRGYDGESQGAGGSCESIVIGD